MARQENQAIREFILRNVEEHPDTVATLARNKFGVTRTGIARYMARLVGEGFISATGNTRARRYELKPLVAEHIFLERDGRWTEDTIWRERIRPLMNGVKSNIVDICQYGFTEMLNNIIEHSVSPNAILRYTQTYTLITIDVIDNGIGIFNKIQNDFHLEDARTALFELSKGKLTSDRKHHSGEGIYFTSRMFDRFSILSGHLYYVRSREDEDDWLVEVSDRDDVTFGTFVRMRIWTNVDRTIRDVFEKYQGDDIYFRKTHIPIVLGRYPGEQLISRSQAKRILARVTNFSELMLDFKGIEEIGQPFADEIFRVFTSQYPDMALITFNTSENIDRMIRFVRSNGVTLTPPSDTSHA